VTVDKHDPADDPATPADVGQDGPEDRDDDPERADPVAPGDSTLADAWWAL